VVDFVVASEKEPDTRTTIEYASDDVSNNGFTSFQVLDRVLSLEDLPAGYDKECIPYSNLGCRCPTIGEILAE
jgi:hypothetical protein